MKSPGCGLRHYKKPRVRAMRLPGLLATRSTRIKKRLAIGRSPYTTLRVHLMRYEKEVV
jgi:hypothetical protein